ncbi:MAG: hypothetical protein AB7E55_20655 [Pigmentiphaga sp.]
MIVAEGFQHLVVIFMLKIVERFEPFGIASWPARGLWWSHGDHVEDERICQMGLTGLIRSISVIFVRTTVPLLTQPFPARWSTLMLVTSTAGSHQSD